jgi:hypothetical protein
MTGFDGVVAGLLRGLLRFKSSPGKGSGIFTGLTGFKTTFSISVASVCWFISWFFSYDAECDKLFEMF